MEFNRGSTQNTPRRYFLKHLVEICALRFLSMVLLLSFVFYSNKVFLCKYLVKISKNDLFIYPFCSSGISL